MAQAKEVRGPGPRGAGQPRPKVENPGLLLKRIMGEVFQHYLPHCIIVLICIVSVRWPMFRPASSSRASSMTTSFP